MLLRPLIDQEIAFCKKYGLDISSWAGTTFKSGTQIKTDGYSLSHVNGTEPSNLGLRRIVVTGKKVGWANQLIRLVHAIIVAQVIGVSRVQIGRVEGFPNQFQVGSIRVEALNESDTSPALNGEFFYTHTLAPLFERHGAEAAETFALLAPHCNFSRQSPRGASTLTIHIRSGDIYSKKKVHGDYGQPPFAFIKKIIDLGGWSDAVLLRENDRSPVISRTMAYLHKRKIPFLLAGKEFENAVTELFRAQNLVLSTGSFSVPALSMSNSIKKAYFFEEDPLKRWGIGNVGANMYQFRETTGLFLKLVWRPWRNSRMQRFLLRNWPTWTIRRARTALDNRGVSLTRNPQVHRSS